MDAPVKSHANLGASSAHRWAACPGSVKLSEGMPNYDTDASREGTAAHAVIERCLNEGRAPDEFIGDHIAVENTDGTFTAVEVTDAMVEAVSVFIGYANHLLGSAGLSGVEESVSLDSLNPPEPMHGTADFWFYSPATQSLEVVDYKNGAGVVVEVKNNLQLRYYALGVLLKLGKPVKTVKITVIQPNALHPDGPIRSEIIDVLELLEFSDELMAAARRTQEPDAPLVTGSHCRFCPASAVCPAQREQVQALAQVEFEVMPEYLPPNPVQIPPEQFDDMLIKLPILKDWVKAMEAEGLRRALSGNTPAGHKLVARRATRKWIDPKVAEETLLGLDNVEPEDIYESKLRSPAQVEKTLKRFKKKLPPGLVEKKSSGMKLVPDTDALPAIAANPDDVFLSLPPGDITQDDE